MFKKLLLVFPIVCLGSVKNNLNSIERKELQESNSFIENKASSSVIDTTKNKKKISTSPIILILKMKFLKVFLIKDLGLCFLQTLHRVLD
jgi:hypothetical protein